MSWFTEIAGKAEDFLNKIDQNAAIVINQATTAATEGSNKRQKSTTVEENSPSIQETYGSIQTYQLSSKNKTNGHEIANNGMKKENHDDSSSERSATRSFRPKKEDLLSSTGVGNKSNSKDKSKSDTTNKTIVPEPDSTSAKVTKKSKTKINKTESSATVSTPPPVNDNEEELIAFLNDSSKKQLDEKFVLQSELANQAREVETLFKSNKKLQSENQTLKTQITLFEDAKAKQGKFSEMEEQVRQSETAQRNLKIHLKEKDAEIEKFKRSLDQMLEKLQQLEALQALQNKLEVVEMEKQKATQVNQELEEQIQSLTNQIQTSEAHISSVKSSLTVVETEFLNYKEKAKSILKQKDDLIASMQGGGIFSGNGIESDSADDSCLSSEVHALRSERELLNAEISQCRATLDSFREEGQRLESELTSIRTLQSQLHKQIVTEKQISSSLQDENLNLRQQLSTLQFELDIESSERRKLTEWKSNREIQEKDNPTSERVSSSSSPTCGAPSPYYSPDTEENLRMRITALTQSLLEKQTLINNLSSDKQLLQINIERLQDEIRHNIGNADDGGNYAAFSQTVISNKPLYLSESPWDSGMSTGVKRAFSSVDTLCCQAGLALRRRPNLRIGFCIYIVFLHFWVLFILFHSFSHVPHMNTSNNGQAPAPM